MACGLLDKGFDLRCKDVFRKYVQKAVLINFDDIASKDFINPIEIFFLLENYKTGYAFIGNEQSEQIKGSFTHSRKKNVDIYTHTVSIPLVGVDVDVKDIFYKLDKGKYVAALKFNDGSVEVFGFEFGLETNNYSYSAQNKDGGGTIELKSKYDEYNPPALYDVSLGSESDFDNLFVTNPITPGDYPLFATTVSITVATEQALLPMATANNIVKTLVAETGTDKQFFDIPDDWLAARPLSRVEFYNVSSGQFDPFNQLSTFAQSSTSHTILGTPTSYTRFTNTSSRRGEITMRLIF